MNKKKIITLVSSTLFLFGGYGAITNPSLSQNVIAKVKTIIKYDHSAEKKTKQIAQENKQTEKKIVSLDKRLLNCAKNSRSTLANTILNLLVPQNWQVLTILGKTSLQ